MTQNYTYDNAGQITSDADTPARGQTQVQCYQYDYLGRLTQAWSQGSSSCCVRRRRSRPSPAPPPRTGNSYTYNAENDMTVADLHPGVRRGHHDDDAYPAGRVAPAARGGLADRHRPLRQRAPTSYGYNADGHLTSASGAQPASP